MGGPRRRPEKAEKGIFRLQRILFECHQVADCPLYCEYVRANCLTASNEGMPGKDEGTSPEDAPKLGEVTRAKADIGEKPKPKSAH